VNLALDPLNPEKASELDDGGGNHRKRKNVGCMSMRRSEFICFRTATDW
jgi:hypothetical protein